MNENVKTFLGAAGSDPELRERLSKMAVGELVAAAREKGFKLTEEDFKPVAGELGEDDLNGVAGGDCGCIVGGGGGGTDSIDGKSYTCGCVLYGQGGDGRAKDANCFCVSGGGGDDDQDWIYTRKK